MSDVSLDSKLFHSRANRLFENWNNATRDPDLKDLASVHGICVVVGDAEEDSGTMKKGVALQTWLLGYEFPSTILTFTKTSPTSRKITILTSQSKAKLLSQIKSTANTEMEVIIRPKDAAGGAKATQSYVDKIADDVDEDTVVLGHFVKDQPKGKMAEEWTKMVKQGSSGKTFELVDVTPAISVVLAPKDEKELDFTTTASRLCSTVMTHYFKPKMESIIDKETKVAHENLAMMVEEKLGSEGKEPDKKIWNKNKQLASVDFGHSDWVYTPIIQSGGKYDLKVSAESNSDPMKSGIILASMGIKYKDYCANIGRTFIIGPHKSQEANYTFLLDLQQTVLKNMKAGTPVKQVYQIALDYVKQKKPDLEEHFVKNLGFGTGIDFRDSSYLINAKNERTLRENMVFNLSLGFQNLPDPKNKGKTYALLLTDTVRVGKETGILLTEGSRKVNEVMLDEEGDESESEDERPAKNTKKPAEKEKSSRSRPSEPAPRGVVVGSKVLRAKTRNQGREVDETKTEKMKQHQRELHEMLKKKGLARFKSGDGKAGNEGKTFKTFESYKREEQLPNAIKHKRIYVDEPRNSVILPIYGFATPFHISTIKNVSKTEEGDYTVLRVNFQSPGQILGRKEDTPFEDPNATFIRSATFRSTDHAHMQKVSEQITNLRKAQNKRENDRKELADVVEQEKLIEIKGRRPHKLIDVHIRPALDAKRIAPGEVELHANGLRYYAQNGNKVDILFSNIKHLFFQPCDNELHAIIHVHLKAPILLNGKKKAKDIQFIRETSDAMHDETGNKKRKTRYGDDDEIEQEQEDRRRRQLLNREFQGFAAKIQETAETQDYQFEVDVPFRELGFNGVPYRSNVLLQPTTDCLVNLTDQPVLVITLSEVEIVHLERVQFGLKNFDMVFIFKDFSRAPVHVNTVPVESLDDIKEWLDSIDIPFSEGPVNLSWPAIMKTVQEDPKEFFAEGGWDFLGGSGDADDAETESEEESAFEADSDVFDDESSESSEDSDAFEESESDSGGSDDTEGEDWDALERKAERDDRKFKEANGDDSGDDERKARKKNGKR
ncbi:FACT complex subunit spt16 [Naganishia albida]|nr:FACT complex subunit spt16 [Naganishia albida]